MLLAMIGASGGGISMDEPQENSPETLREGMTAASQQGKKSWQAPRLMRFDGRDANNTTGHGADGAFATSTTS
jgi:hypothetical protein